MTLSQEALCRSQPSPCGPFCHQPGLSLKTLLLAALLLFIHHPAQVFAQASEVTDDVVRVRTDLVTAPVVVLDSHERRVPDLTRDDFTVLDNGRAVQLDYFAAGTERVALAFALDISGSTRDILSQQHKTALALFSRFGQSSRVAVLQFSERAALAVPFTTDTEQARAGFNAPAMTGHKTAIFDAAAAAVRAFDNHGDRTERRIVILISDGLDNGSSTSALNVINAARLRAVSFYVIHLPLFAPKDGRLVPRPAARGFRALAEQTGGRYFMVGDVKSALDPHAQYDLAPVFKAIEDDLKAQYVIGYYPGEAARDGRFHQIEIRLTSPGKRKLHAQTLNAGYSLNQ